MGLGGGEERDGALDEHPDESECLEEDEAALRRRVGGESGHVTMAVLSDATETCCDSGCAKRSQPQGAKAGTPSCQQSASQVIAQKKGANLGHPAERGRLFSTFAKRGRMWGTCLRG